MKNICWGKNGKFNGDNLEIRVNIKDIRMFNKDNYYYFCFKLDIYVRNILSGLIGCIEK